MKATWFGFAGLLSGFLLISGCGTTGKEFDETRVENIVNGTTTQDQVEELFGPPFKKGVLNGRPIWVYEYNKYMALGDDTSKDLVIVFEDTGVVRSHQFMSDKGAAGP